MSSGETRAARAVVTVAAGALLSVPVSLAAEAYLTAPPPGHTGGFGEPTCASCHFDAEPVAASEAMRLEGFPDRYEYGRTYSMVVMLRQEAMRVAGFQLSVRFAEGEEAGAQAGELEAVDGGVAVTRSDSGPVYIHHTRGHRPSDGVVRWRIEWTAPEAGGEVVMHVAGNAANGDDSEFGDRIHLREAGSAPASPEPAATPSPVRPDVRGR